MAIILDEQPRKQATRGWKFHLSSVHWGNQRWCPNGKISPPLPSDQYTPFRRNRRQRGRLTKVVLIVHIVIFFPTRPSNKNS